MAIVFLLAFIDESPVEGQPLRSWLRKYYWKTLQFNLLVGRGSSLLIYLLQQGDYLGFFPVHKNRFFKNYPSIEQTASECFWGTVGVAVHSIWHAIILWKSESWDSYIWGANPGDSWFATIILYLVVVFLMELHFYACHRLFHTKWLYDNFHYLHHSFRNTTSFTSQAEHPVESFVLATWVMVFAVLRVPESFLDTFAMQYFLQAAIIHQGHHTKWAEPLGLGDMGYDHYIHHTRVHYNFGSTSIYDKLFGTYYKRSNNPYSE